ncbi:9663_t:CDS:2 [Racocetra fulgida]|uniref:9663_t:CDS:1 n=1 Tax=Racocetra fulgida TaxID=60492 RepID=A0A9N8WJ65_9GLOM|nr:9663_t:CDS:2 [Racocetra fulgida]
MLTILTVTFDAADFIDDGVLFPVGYNMLYTVYDDVVLHSIFHGTSILTLLGKVLLFLTAKTQYCKPPDSVAVPHGRDEQFVIPTAEVVANIFGLSNGVALLLNIQVCNINIAGEPEEDLIIGDDSLIGIFKFSQKFLLFIIHDERLPLLVARSSDQTHQVPFAGMVIVAEFA